MRQLFRKGDIVSNGRRCLLVFILCMMARFAQAETDPIIVSVLKGSANQIKKDSVAETIDPIFYNPSLVGFIENPANDTYRNVVSLLIDEDNRTFFAANFTVTVYIKIIWVAKNGIEDSTSKSLEVDYKVGEGTKYKARDYFYFDNARQVKIRVDSVNTHGAGISPDPTSVLILENRMEVKRDYTFSCSTTALGVDAEPGYVSDKGNIDELIVNWTPQAFAGITHYDVEWSWIDTAALGRYKTGGNPDARLIFRNNASRITVPGAWDSCRIPLIYDGVGYLYYRVRPVQYRENGQIVEGSWSANGISGLTYYSYNGHEDSLNWQVRTTYAEDGKRQTVVQYFDGAMHGRQIVTKDNSLDTARTIVSETFYDYQGRPALNILPAPTLNTVIEYAHNFNRFTIPGNPKNVYDSIPDNQTICNYNTAALDSNYGTARYYSSNNPKVNEGIHRYIPNAEGFPYSETRYVPDATGRIAAQSGVGPAFQLSSGHETKYFYGYADQHELNALFGTEVGHFSHYFKNMIRDANGQYSVRYIDMHGRTIATALAGTPPANLKKLDSYTEELPWLTRNLLSNNTVKNRTVESATTLLVPQGGPHQFEYSLSPQSAEIIACNPEGQPVCYDCYYDLEIRITGTCGETPIVINRKNFSFGVYDTSCITGAPALTVDTTITLSEGEYNITKTLSLSQHAQTWYRDSVFAKKNICKTLEQFYTDIFEVMMDSSNCEMTCESCELALGTEAQYRVRFLTELGIDTSNTVAFENEIKAAYAKALADCKELCEEPESKLDAIRRLMLQDMTPDQGQYAKLDKDLDEDGSINEGVKICPPGDNDPSHCEWEINSNRPFNIFKDNYVFRHPIDTATGQVVSYYPGEDGVFNENTTPQLNDNDLTPQQFSEQFGPNWAMALLYYHPEYCKLKIAETDLGLSYKWDAKLESVNTWQAAAILDFDTDILDLDPFFSGPGDDYKPAMTAMVNTNYHNTGKSMWQLAWMSVHCPTGSNTSCVPPTMPFIIDTCSGDWNNVWRIFRALYLSVKDSMVNDYLDAQCSINYNILDQHHYERRFGDIKTFSPNFNTLMGELNTIIANGNYQTGGDDLFEEQEAVLYAETCAGYIEMWRTKLLACDSLARHPQADAIIAEIVNGMKDVCFRGSDVDHPYGSSTVKPNDPVSPRSFEQVIANVFAAHLIPVTALCHPYLVDYPQPYNFQSPISDDIIVEPKDSCICARLTELKQEKENLRYPGTLSQFISYQHGVTIRQTFLDTLIGGCNGSPVCATYDPPLNVPAILSCTTNINNCIDCDTYTKLKAGFKATYSSFNVIHESDSLTQQQVNENTFFASYMNAQAGLNKSWVDYLQFEKACNAHNTTWSCFKLDSIVTLYHGSHPNPGVGDSCETSFTTFFNAAFSTSYTFQQIQMLFLQHCGRLPVICSPMLDCKGFQIVIADFYQEYGKGISDSTNCQALFTAFFNDHFNTAYTWDEIAGLYKKLCGYDLDVCNTVSCARLQEIIDSWYGCHNTAWLDSNCVSQWVSYFNLHAGTTLQAWEIEEWYKRCNIPLHPCLPPVDAHTMQNLVQAFNNAGSNACAPELSCEDCFVSFINTTLGRSFTYEQIALMYKKATSKPLEVCSSRFTVAALTTFSNNFIDNNQGNVPLACDSLFTALFDTAFNVSYNFEQVMAVYELHTGSRPDVCKQQSLLNCNQIESVRVKFMALYPDPVNYFGANYREAFTVYFNQAVGDTLTFEDIFIFYGTLCGHELNFVDTTACQKRIDFLEEFNDKYGAAQLPQALCRELFVNLYNKRFLPKDIHEWDDLARLYDTCGVVLDTIFCHVVPGMKLDCSKLPGALEAFRQLYDNKLPGDCHKVFTSLFNQYYETSFTDYSQLIGWAKDNCGVDYDLCGSAPEPVVVALRPNVSFPPVSMGPRLCSSPIFFTIEPEDEEPCDFVQELALNAATEQHNVYVQNKYENFDSTYKNKCLSAGTSEVFTVRSQVAEYHYTLYYYDQAGNLVKTVPPAGARPDFSDAFYDSVEVNRINGGSELPPHTLATQYRYNTLNQVVQQKSPDGGLTKFWYDALARSVVSQNAKQISDNKYSYTLFDLLGRITEVGEITSSQAMTQAIAQNPDILTVNSLPGWITTAAASRKQVINMVYDVAEESICVPGSPGLCQKNLRNHISYTTLTDAVTDGDFASATYYSYDIHGNVDTLMQRYRKGIMYTVAGHEFKRIVYKYDLISGKVTEVAYQPGVTDQFYHRYEYDAENRLIEAWTSHDHIYWERQAKYEYYRSGPLARTEIGQLGVQGMDYAFTLQGWLKGMNSTSITPSNGDPTASFDVGGDGKRGGRVARDAFGFSLNYFSEYSKNSTIYGDYKSINGVTPFATVADGLPAITDAVVPGKDLYNGNIKATIVNVPKLGDAMLYGYQYDQLNRITAMNAYTGLNASTNVLTSPTGTNNYRERVSYDPNGNILAYTRNGAGTGGSLPAMDDLHYKYYYITNSDTKAEYDPAAGLPASFKELTNQLAHVDDNTAYNGNFDTDIDDQGANNYVYDAIGNITSDTKEGITNIEWTVYGKISKIVKSRSTTYYVYDAAGNRIGKRVDDLDHGITETWYVRDASGNVMSVYENNNPDLNGTKLTQVELGLFGSTRLGVWRAGREVQSAAWDEVKAEPWVRGNIAYELSNHLRNVVVTVSDRKLQVQHPVNTSEVDYFLSDILTANDYYPFGSLMPGRKFSAGGSYRYGFNGKENDNDVKGEGNQQDYGMRIYDPRLGKFLSVDPLTSDFPQLTPYQFASNCPIEGIDLDGMEYTSAKRPEISPYIQYDPEQKKITGITTYLVYQNLIGLTRSKLLPKYGPPGADWQTYTGNLLIKYSDIDFSAEILTDVQKVLLPEVKDPADQLKETDETGKSFTYTSPTVNKVSKKFRNDVTRNNGTAGVKVNTVEFTGGNKVSAAITGVTIVVYVVAGIISSSEFDNASAQSNFIMNTVRFKLSDWLDKGLIPEEYRDSHNLTQLADYLLNGQKPMKTTATGKTVVDQELLDIGVKMWR